MKTQSPTNALRFAAALACTAAFTVACDSPAETDEGMATESTYDTTLQPPVDAEEPGLGVDPESREMGMIDEPTAGADSYDDELGSDAEPGQPLPEDQGEDPPGY